jgi:glycosyltransferase involved in cell wall biosynthesis
MGAPWTVLHVITRLEPGGAQRNTLHTVAHLDRAAFRPALAWGPGDLLDPLATALADVTLVPLPDLVREVAPGRDRRAFRALRRAMATLAPAVVHTHSSKAGILGRLAARCERVPVVVHSVHGFGFTPVQPLLVRAAFFLAERVAARWTDHTVAVSRANRDLGVELGLYPASAVSVIRSGIALDRFPASPEAAAAARRRLDLPAAGPLVTQIGNFKPQKAPLDFVRVAAALAHAHPTTTFVMVGDGPLKAAAVALAEELGVAGRLRFPGWVDDVPALLAATRVSILTSRHEGLPRAVVESLAAGVPVVATAVDGTVEVVRDGVNGFLRAPGDVAGIAAAVARLLADDGEWGRMAAAAPRGLGEFSIDLMVRQQEELYRCLLGRS